MNKRRNKGITLVALVITIIVLLILAGVSISMALGENGVLTRASEAVEKNSEAKAYETIQTAVAASIDTSIVGNGMKLDYDTLVENLRDVGVENLWDIESFPVYAELDGYGFAVQKNGKVDKAGGKRANEDLSALNNDMFYFGKDLVFDGTNYVDTGIKLFSEENRNKNFQIKFKFKDIPPEYNSLDTIINAMYEVSSKSYPGWVFRRSGSTGLQWVFTYSTAVNGLYNIMSLDSNEYNDQPIILARVGNKYYFNTEGFYEEYTEYECEPYDTPVTLGCSLDANQSPYRYCKVTIPMIQIMVTDDASWLDKEEPIYAKLYDNKILTFSKDRNKELPDKSLTTDYGVVVSKYYSTAAQSASSHLKNTPWYNDRAFIEKVVFLDEIKPFVLDSWFYGCRNLRSFENIQNLNTSKVVSMKNLFSGCESLTSLDLSNFNTSHVKYMDNMFANCYSLTELKNNFNLKKVYSAAGIINGSSQIKTEFTITNNFNRLKTAFSGGATADNASVVFNYTADAGSVVDAIIAQKAANQKFTKGVQK